MSRITSAAKVIRDSHRRSIYLRIAVFFAASCLFSWWGYAIALATGNDGWAGHFPYGPMFAAILTISVTEGKAGLREWWRRISRVRGPARFYALAATGPTAIVLASTGVALLAGIDAPGSSLWLDSLLSAVILLVPMAFVMGPVGEELAFRGWGQYKLQSAVTPLTASLLIGLGVVVWHLPIIAIGDIPVVVIVALPAVSVVYAWLYRMSGTVWTAVTLHTFLNVTSGVFAYEIFDGGAPEFRFGIVAAGFVAWAAYIVARYGPSLVGRNKRSPLQLQESRTSTLTVIASR
jgi:membrane protease YdiL (CAAX protease family)